MTTNTHNQNRAGLAGALFSFAAMGLLLLGMWGCEPSQTEERTGPVQATGEVLAFTLIGYMDGYVGVGGDIDGVQNPTLTVNAGDEVELHFINGENMPHDIALKDHDVASDMLVRTDEETTLRFVAEVDDEYYCTVPGHEQAGMIGALRVLQNPDGQSSSSEPRAQLD